MELIRKTLKAASTSTEMRAVRLYCTARKIIEMYCAITPTYHKKFLDTLPQQAGKNYVSTFIQVLKKEKVIETT
jgi:hypothetical protein